ncbi:MAG: response regulator transcription factor [Candidatus Eremiobacteraeota bacterium]|nr:response regulator transcription factor [Candidatus Eremiobacteraeota bacterium]
MRILVAEDEPKIAAFMKRGLEEEGFVVDTAADGRDAFSRATTGGYDAMVLDIMMPIIDGITVCRSLRTQGSTIPILMLTARDSLEDKLGGFASGADDYLAKPFSFEELVARLRALLRRSSTSTPPQLKVADLVLDTATRSATRAGTPIELTNREYQLLHLLMRNAGAVQTRTTLLQRIWGFSFAGSTNVLEAYVRLLRRKIDDGRPVRLLRTVRGVGYVVREN